MTTSSDVARFQAATRHPTYRQAMAAAPPRMPLAGRIAALLGFTLCYALLWLPFVAGAHWPIWPPAVLWAVFVAWLVIPRGGPTRRELACVVASYTDHRPVGRVTMSTTCTVTLRDEHGRTDMVTATERAAAAASEGDIGVAVFRGRTLVWFERIDV